MLVYQRVHVPAPYLNQTWYATEAGTFQHRSCGATGEFSQQTWHQLKLGVAHFFQTNPWDPFRDHFWVRSLAPENSCCFDLQIFWWLPWYHILGPNMWPGDPNNRTFNIGIGIWIHRDPYNNPCQPYPAALVNHFIENIASKKMHNPTFLPYEM